MTTIRIVTLRALLAVLVGGALSGCLPVGFRGSSIYIIGNAPALTGH